ncbi:uncharacterized protein LOC124613297 [Schistocerca americana]|uniref:uncharacterized protein LOC124613297 n=1 Tax=Schistocerca americana TaxID=7009 RepID=UPI001F500782|nr:uncharacterized protein LOC124613297 [Schistocerca americana]
MPPRRDGRPSRRIVAAVMERVFSEALGFGGGKPRRDVQCFRCQRFGHVAKYCRRNQVACMKCAEPHDTRDCTKPRDVAPKCANCRRKHVASFRGCSYIANWGRGGNKKRKRKRRRNRSDRGPAPAAGTDQEQQGAPPPPEKRHHDDAVPHNKLRAATEAAVADLKAAFAAERTALRDELAAAHREIQRLRAEVASAAKVLRLTPPAPTPTGGEPANEMDAMETDPDPAPPPSKKKMTMRISKDLEGLLALAASEKVEAATKEHAAPISVSVEEQKKAVSRQPTAVQTKPRDAGNDLAILLEGGSSFAEPQRSRHVGAREAKKKSISEPIPISDQSTP